jgi:hypothetical protein
MTDAAFYRNEAERYRKLAAAEPDPELAKQWRDFAQDFDLLVAILQPDDAQPQEADGK